MGTLILQVSRPSLCAGVGEYPRFIKILQLSFGIEKSELRVLLSKL